MLCQQRCHDVDKLGQLVPIQPPPAGARGSGSADKECLSHTRRLGDPVKLQISDAVADRA
jgi:hypothetical protein